MNKYPKISIITPTLNQGDFIEETINSVISQGYPNLEYIIIDGGSTDNTIEIIKKYEKHLSYWVSEPDHGQSDAINKGLKYCSGEIFNWINSDDYYVPDALQFVANSFSNPNVNVVCGRSRLFGNNITPAISKGTRLFENNLYKTIGYALIDQPATFFRKSVFDLLCPVNEKLKYLMDLELWLKYLFIFDLAGIFRSDSVLVNFRKHDLSKTGSQFVLFEKERNAIYYSIAKQYNFKNIIGLLDELKINNNNYEFDFNPPPPEKLLIEKLLNYYLLLLGDQFYYYNQTKIAKQVLKRINSEFLSLDDIKYLKNLSKKNYIKSILLKLGLWQKEKK